MGKRKKTEPSNISIFPKNPNNNLECIEKGSPEELTETLINFPMGNVKNIVVILEAHTGEYSVMMNDGATFKDIAGCGYALMYELFNNV